jgi:hypothetical protein
MKQLLFIALAVFIIFSCTYEDIDYQVQPSQNSEVVISLSQDNAIIKARSFLRSFIEKTRGDIDSEEISSIYPLRISSFSNPTRSASCPTIASDTIAYVINFRHHGFAIISAVNQTEEVLAYIPHGNLSQDDDISKTGIEYFLNLLPDYIDYITSIGGIPNDSLINPGGGGTGGGTGGGLVGPTSIDTLKAPLIKTHWGQKSPYNMFCPIRNGVRAPAGCIATALSQIMAYHKHPSSC